MSRVHPLELQIKALGAQQAEGEIRRIPTVLDAAVVSGQRANRTFKETQKSGVEMGARIAAASSQSAQSMGQVESKAHRMGVAIFTATKKGIQGFTGLDVSVQGVGRSVSKVLDKVDQLRKKLGAGLMATGFAEGTLMGKGVAIAGQMQLTRKGFATQLGGEEEADRFIERIRDFDRESPYDFQQSINGAQRMGAMGFKKDEIIPIMRVLGDAVSAGGGTSEEFGAAITAFGQIRTLGKVEMDELRQLAEGARMPVFDILRESIGQERLAKIMGGEEKMTADEAMPILLKGLNARFGGQMEEATKTLPGQLSTLKSAFMQLGESIGKYLIPPTVWLVGVATQVVDFFNNLPEPIKAIVAYGYLFGAAFKIVLGALILVYVPLKGFGMALKVIGFLLPGLNAALGLFGLSVRGLAISLVGKLVPAIVGMTIPAILSLGFYLLAFAAAAGVAVYLWQKYADELKKPLDTVEDQRTGSQKEEDETSARNVRNTLKENEGLSKTDRYALLKAAYSKANDLGDTELGAEIEKERLALAKDLRGAGIDTAAIKMAESAAARDAIANIKAQAANNKADRLSPVKKADEKKNPEDELNALLEKWGSGNIKPQDGGLAGINFGDTSPLTIGGAEAQLRSQQSADVKSAQGEVDRLQSEVYALQDAKRGATKEQKEVIAQQLTEKQRQLSAARRELSAAKTLSRQEEQSAKKADREAKKRGDLYEKDARGIDKVRSDNAYNERVDDLSDQLDKAKEDADEARVRSLTIQIEKLKAQREYDEAMINARDEEDAIHRKGMEAIAAEKYKYDAGRGALRKAQKAVNGLGDKKKSLTPAQIRAIFNATGATMLGNGGNALGSDINYGDRFADTKSSLWGQSDMQAMRDGIAGVGDFGANNRAQMEKERRIRVKSMTENSKGERTIRFVVEDLVLPPSGLDEVVI